MTDAVKRRLDVLIVLCSALLGVALTFSLFSEPGAFRFLLAAAIPTALVAGVAFWVVPN